MPDLPRLDQIRDFFSHRATRAVGRKPALALGASRLYAGPKKAGAESFCSYSVMLSRLDSGASVSVEDLLREVSAQLDRANKADGSGDRRAATTLVDRAIRLAFHPTVQNSISGSPLMLDTERFLEPFRVSPAARRFLFELDPVDTDAPPRQARDGRARRVLILCHSSWTFIDRVVADLQQNSGLEFRTFDVSRLPLAERPTHSLAVRMRAQWSTDKKLRPVPDSLAVDLEWADTVFVEWGTYPFAWFSFLDVHRFNIRTVARLHRFEMLTPYPLLARSAAYDAIGFVSPPLLAFLEAVSPRLAQAGGTALLHNIHDLSGFEAAEKRDIFTLAQIGWATPIKDVGFSLKVLQKLRAVDRRYRLVLIGPTPKDSTSTARWAKEFESQIDALGSSVEVLGFRKDVPTLLGRMGFLLSSSGNEGTHESVAEAAAAGCVPVVRNWPEIAPWGGARMIYPDAWIIEDADEAASRILALSDPSSHTEESRASSRWIREHRDPSTIRRRYLTLLGADYS